MQLVLYLNNSTYIHITLLMIQYLAIIFSFLGFCFKFGLALFCLFRLFCFCFAGFLAKINDTHRERFDVSFNSVQEWLVDCF